MVMPYFNLLVMDGWMDGWMDGRMDGWMSLMSLSPRESLIDRQGHGNEVNGTGGKDEIFV